MLDLVAAWAEGAGLLEQERVLALLGEAFAACEAARVLVYRVVDERAKGRPPSGLANVARVAAVEAERMVADATVELMGEEGLVSGRLADVQHRNPLAVGLAGGTFEVQLNLVSQLVLDLPRSETGVRPAGSSPGSDAMNLELTDEQRMISEGVGAIVERMAGPERCRILGDECGYDAALEDVLGEQGYLRMFSDRDAGPLEAVLMVEQVARALGTVATGALAVVAPALGVSALRGPVGLSLAVPRDDTPVRFAALPGTLVHGGAW